MNLCYPVEMKEYSTGTAGLFFTDIPEAITAGNTKAEAIDHGPDALVVALSGYVEEGRPIPVPSRAKRGQVLVCLPPMAALKLAIHDAMIRHHITQTALAERLGMDTRQVRRILDLDHESKLSQMEMALAALGLRATVSIESSPAMISA